MLFHLNCTFGLTKLYFWLLQQALVPSHATSVSVKVLRLHSEAQVFRSVDIALVHIAHLASPFVNVGNFFPGQTAFDLLRLAGAWHSTLSVDFCMLHLQDYKTLYATMKRIADAEPRDLDTWSIGISAGDHRELALPSWTAPTHPVTTLCCCVNCDVCIKLCIYDCHQIEQHACYSSALLLMSLVGSNKKILAKFCHVASLPFITLQSLHSQHTMHKLLILISPEKH